MSRRSSGRPLARSSVAAILLACAAVRLCGGEPLLCRGFEAASAASALTARGGALIRLDPALHARPAWLAVVGDGSDAAHQALAHALGCWWTPGLISAGADLPALDPTVRSYPPLPAPPPDAEALLQRLMRPWMGGPGGLVMDLRTGALTATASASGHQHLEQLLVAMSDPRPRAPHLPAAARPPERRLARSPAGAGLGDWCLDLARLAGVALALAPDLDPRAPPPAGEAPALDDALRLLAAAGVRSGMRHGVLCLSAAPPEDRRHPAERAAVAVLPVGHLTRDPGRMAALAEQLAARAAPEAWALPGWGIAPLAGRAALLVVGSGEAVHAVMTALEAADQAGLDAWMR